MENIGPVGIGLRPPHYQILEEDPSSSIQFLEVISENYMDTEGRPLSKLLSLRKKYPIGLHGVSLSLGSVTSPSISYLRRLQKLIERVDPFLVSDHLCYTGLSHNNLHNLLPLIYDEENLQRIVSHISLVQDFLKRPIAIENLSAYYQFQNSTYTEWDFLKRVAVQSGCLILLDINNIYVNACNHHFDPRVYLDAIPAHLIGQVHLAGFTDCGDFLFDTHSRPVFPAVWDLLDYKMPHLQNVPLLIEWDEDIPEFSVLEQEAKTAQEKRRLYYAQTERFSYV